ncbi:MAG: DNA polymerase III subunit delta [Paracoccaceae bacterium]
MKLLQKNQNDYFLNPDPSMAGLLLYGANSARVHKKKKDFIKSLLGTKSSEEMRIEIIGSSELRKEPSLLIDAVKIKGFFSGPRCVLIENATDGIADIIKDCLSVWNPGDAYILLTANFLSPKSTLRKLFENDNNVYVAPIFDDLLTYSEIKYEIEKFGFETIEKDASSELIFLGQTLGVEEFSQMLEKLSLYKLNDITPISYKDIKEIVPTTFDKSLEDAASIIADGRTAEIASLLRKLEAQGIQVTTLCIGTTLYFKKLYKASNDPSGTENGLKKLRPPIPFKKADKMVQQIKEWGSRRLAEAISMLVHLDLELRTKSNTPSRALMERVMIRLSLMPRR